jgi:hypothetical protein
VRSCFRLLLPTLLALTPALQSCKVDCGFEPHCDGNVAMDCSVGVDQLVGKGTPVITPCVEPAPLCTPRNASEGRSTWGEPRVLCARAPLTPCDASFTDSCEGTLRVYCLGGYVTAEDCTDFPGTGRCGQRLPDGPITCL